MPILSASSVPTVSADQMTAVDRSAIEDYGVTLLQMMEQAGSHLTEVVRVEAGGDLRDRCVVVAAGPGNNGGGGLVAARHLANRGAIVRVVLSRPALRMTEAGRHQLATLLAMGAHCCVATFDLADDDLERVLGEADIVVDAVLGYRALGAPRGEEERLVGFLTRADRPVVSLDLPSGLDPDDGSTPGAAVTAVATLTLALPKPGLFRGAGPAHAGRVYLGDLGLPTAMYAALDIPVGTPFSSGRIVLLEQGA
ncbi:MAG: NAD(P)H-hydrate epimerase [Chloroflexota bacterium]